MTHYSPYQVAAQHPFDLGDNFKSVLKSIPPAIIDLPPGVNYRSGIEPEVLPFRGGMMVIFLNVPHTISKMNDGSYDLCLSFYHKPYPPSFFKNEFNHPQFKYYRAMEKYICKSWRISVANFVRYEVLEDETYTCIKLFYI